MKCNITFLSRITGIGVFLIATCVQGATMTFPADAKLLSSLTGGGTIKVGDKVFGDFTYAQTGDMPPATGVNVIPLIQDGNFGLRFQAGFIDQVGAGASDALITFSVTAPGKLINGSTLAGNPAAPGGIGSITETFLPELATTMMTVTSGSNLTATVAFAPVQKLNVQKDILLIANNAPTTLSFVDQSFPQVPEPATGMLFTFGLLGLMGWRRKTR